MSYFTNPVTGNNTMYIDQKLNTQAQNLSYNISYGKNLSGFQTPSTNYLPYVINEDLSITYTEQGKIINLYCNDNPVDLYNLIQPYTYTNNINNGFYGYDATGYTNQDAAHTTTDGTSNYYGVWFQYDFSQFSGGISYNIMTVNIPDYTQAPTEIKVFEAYSANPAYWIPVDIIPDIVPVNPPWIPTPLPQSRNYVCTKTRTATYLRVLISKVVNNQNFCISSIQFTNDYFRSQSQLATFATSPVNIGYSLMPMYLNYYNLTVNGTLVDLPNSLSKLSLDDTFPPTNTSTATAATVNVVTQLYNSNVNKSMIDISYPPSTSTSNIPSSSAVSQIYSLASGALQVSSLINTYPPTSTSLTSSVTANCSTKIYNLANGALQTTALDNTYPPTSVATTTSSTTNVVRQVYNLANSALQVSSLINTYPPTSTSSNVAVTANVVRQVYNAIPVSTPQFYFKYTTSTISTTANTALQFFGASFWTTLAYSNLNGLLMSSIINSSTNILTIPYTGSYSVSAFGYPGYWNFLSASGTYGANGTTSQNPLKDMMYYNGGNHAGFSFTFFAVAGDTFKLVTYPAASVTNYQGSYTVTLINRIA